MSTKHFPACFVELPPCTEGRRAAFYLAAEEYIADTLPEGSYFFTWQLRPTVVMGRNQVAHQEVNLDFCQQEGIDVIRRRSGGGAIFADEGNIMTSLITESGSVETLFQEYAEAVAAVLRQLGAPAQVAGRNDIVLKTAVVQKVCGNAFYQRGNRCIAHGTMLYDTNPRLMEGALHPDVSKLEQKGVKSVRSRVGLLKDHLPFGVGTLRQQLRTLLCDRTVALTDGDVRCIQKLEQQYYAPDYLMGSTGHADLVRGQRIEGVGRVELHIRLKGSLIKDVELTGDFFDLGHAAEVFHTAFTGIPFTPESLRKAIRDHHPEHSIRGLGEDGLLHLLNQQPVSEKK